MSRDKQTEIEEMAKDFCALNMPCEECHLYKNRCHAKKYATRAYNAGYRKSTDFAEEIIGIIKQRMATNDDHKKGVKNTLWQAHYNGCMEAYRDIKEIIEQKYTEEGK